MHSTISAYNQEREAKDRGICEVLAGLIDAGLPEAESKVWHGHPVWFLDGNPIVGYSRQKKGIRLMFWSGANFNEPGLEILGGKFKDASVFYQDLSEIDEGFVSRCLGKSRRIQWDYKNIVKNKGTLHRLGETGPTGKFNE